ncbi:MAG TPA: cob(I)yrinic acid a,c-diamide adenosyltransferase [Firmicutes bacterium]|nr:cob(I)yrinic acid a,c-diamide adenosyltransferase [Bacillota bacterium]
MSAGLIHLYCGDGKGKTSAAMGLALRAAGRNKKVLITQFLKNNRTGELYSLKQLETTIDIEEAIPVQKFVWHMTDAEKEACKVEHTQRFQDIIKKVEKDDYDVLILDELIATINLDFVPLKTVLNFLVTKPEKLEVVLTGRDPLPELIELADYVSEIKAIKHPFDKGVNARKGIEF